MAAGEEILAFCSSCKLDLRHMIVAHKSGNTGAIAKVECKTCRKMHAYRAPKGSGGNVVAPKKARAPRAKAEAIPVSVEWNRQLSEQNGKEKKRYSIQSVFSAGDLVDHPQFGLGIIQEIRDATKIAVLFQNSMRLLVHNKK